MNKIKAKAVCMFLAGMMITAGFSGAAFAEADPDMSLNSEAAIQTESPAPAEEAPAENPAPAETIQAENSAPAETIQAENPAPAETIQAENSAPAETIQAENPAPTETFQADAGSSEEVWAAAGDAAGTGELITVDAPGEGTDVLGMAPMDGVNSDAENGDGMVVLDSGEAVLPDGVDTVQNGSGESIEAFQDTPLSAGDISYVDGLFAAGSETISRKGLSGTDDGTKKLIVGFQKVGLIQSISFAETNKPSLSELMAQFPSAVDVYFVGESTPTTIPVTWESVEGDFSTSGQNYFLFTPLVDSSLYSVRGMDEMAEAPYIEVKKDIMASVEMIASAPPTVNEKAILKFCMEELSLNKAAACGILGNLYCESGFRTNAIGDGNTSCGICQWHNGRWTNLRNYTSDWQTLEGQLSYMKYELLTGYYGVLSYLQSVPDTAQGAYDAGYYWCLYYEMPDAVHSRGITRGCLARNIYWPRYAQELSDCSCNDSFAGIYRCTSEDGLIIRDGHSTDGDSIGFIPSGAEVEITRADGKWAHVTYEGTSGYCKMEYLILLEAADVLDDELIEAGLAEGTPQFSPEESITDEEPGGDEITDDDFSPEEMMEAAPDASDFADFGDESDFETEPDI